MTDDIVTRLRERHGQFRVVVGVNEAFVLETIHGEAADEIERLGADRDRWKECVEYAYWDIRRTIECAEWAIPSPHPLWSDLNELMEIMSWMEKLLNVPNRWESMKERVVRGE